MQNKLTPGIARGSSGIRPGRAFRWIVSACCILGTSAAQAQLCTPALEREKITPTANFYDFNGATADGNVTVVTIFPQTQNLGWTGTGGGNVFAMSNATVFNHQSANSAVSQSFTRALTNANLAGTGAVVTIKLSPKNVSGGATAQTTSYDPSIKATYEVLYNSTVYLKIETTDDATTTATVTPLAGASVTIDGAITNTGSTATIPMTANGAWPSNPTWSTLTITLPATIANSANLATRFSVGATGTYPGGTTRVGDDFVVQSVSFKSCPANITGSIFDDADGAASVNGTAIGGPGSASGQLYVNLVNTGGNVVNSVAVATDGTYSLPAYAAGNFTLRLSAIQGIAGQPAPATGLPAGWHVVSESDGSPDLSQSETVANANTNTTLIDNNFGINLVPVAAADTLPSQVPGTAATVPDILANDTDDTPLLSPDSVSLIAPAGATGITADAQGDTTGFTIPGEGTWILNADGSITFTPEAGFTGDPTPVQYVVTDAAGLNSNPATITIDYNLPLPIVLHFFEGKATGNCAVALNWKTGKEDAFSGFDIESSTDARAFNKIGELAAKGNNSNYSFEYKDAVQGKNYFRLKLKDRDGYSSNSDVVTIYVDCITKRSIKVYPTVVDHSFIIEGLRAGETISVVDVSGKQVLSATARQAKEQIALNRFANGTYYIMVLTESKEQLSFKIVKR